MSYGRSSARHTGPAPRRTVNLIALDVFQTVEAITTL